MPESRQDQHCDLDQFSLRGKVALITGATRGLGSEIAAAMAAAGAHVVINGRSQETASRVALSLRQRGYQASDCAFDVADETALNTELSKLQEATGGPSILVSNVGARHRATLDELTSEDFREILRVDLAPTFTLVRTIVPQMRQRGWGRIITISSIAGPLARSGDLAYTSAKGGLAALTRALAVELAPFGITCNSIAPGFFLTESNAQLAESEAIHSYVRSRVPLRRWGNPAEIGGAAVFLASPAASYVNGLVLTVDGGLSVAF